MGALLPGERSRAASSWALLLAVLLLLTVEASPPPVRAEAWADFGAEHFDATVYALAEFRGDLVATGNFVSVGGRRVNHIARWDGSSWHALGSGLGRSDPDANPYQIWGTSLLVHEDQLYVGGVFDRAGGIEARYVARWDGAQWHPVGTGFDDRVYDLEVYRGRIIASGTFRWAGDRSTIRVAQFSSGTWRNMEAGIGYPVYDLHVHDDVLYAGGMFGATSTGRPLERLAAWDGSSWWDFADRFEAFDGRGRPVIPTVLAMASYGGRLVVGGIFDAIDGEEFHSLAVLDAGRLRPLSSTPNLTHDRVFSLEAHDGELVVGGLGDDPSPAWLRQIARWDGSRFLELDGGVDDFVQALLSTPEGLVVGGSFAAAGGVTMPAIATWNGPVTVDAPPVRGLPEVVLEDLDGRQVRLQVSLDRSGPLVVDVYDLRGRHVDRVFTGRAMAGSTTLVWDGRDRDGGEVARGRYLLHVDAGRGGVALGWTRRR